MPLNRPVREWDGRRVWIVGASSGIGAALAEALAARGARLALSARRREALEAVAARCDGALVVPMDVTISADHARTASAVQEALGAIDMVIFNAGTYRPMRAWELDPASIRHMVDTNLTGVMEGVAAVVPRMLARGEGAIVLVGSVAGYGGLPKAAAYGPTKAALINFAEVLHLDLAPRGIDVFLVNPGFVDTPLTQQNDFHMPALMTAADAAESILEGFAAGRFEIHFPRRFTRVLKLMAMLPRRLYFALVRRTTGL
ncbi:MAG: SDR family NAD(P)-dependent oxidoreductase [Zoogloeaceae bacterium]|nr:SDR family NAD(P)-dependent oxidoreductase [Zoogloeaceae bacterium]